MPDNCVDMIYGDPIMEWALIITAPDIRKTGMNIWIGMSNWQLNVCRVLKPNGNLFF